ncbi:MAG: response regulator [Sulfurimonadaceae bacterium]
MIEMLEDYLQIGAVELIYAFVLTLFIFLSGYFYNISRESVREAKRLKLLLAEAELDKASLQANITVQPEHSASEQEVLKIEPGSSNTILQQELENYLLREEEKAQAAAQNFVELSADFVDFLKMKSGKIKLKESTFTLNDMLGDLAKSLRSLTARTRVELIFDIDPKVPPKLIGDKRHIRLLLFNVLSNIIHHQSETQVILHAESIKEENSLRVQFRVQGCRSEEDAGGMDSLFVPFSDSAFDESMQIEFYIARELSRMMQGDIALGEDEMGRNEFNIELVLAEANPDDNRLYRLPSRSMTGHKILIVNENKMLAKSIQNMYEYFKNDVTLLISSEFASNPEIISEFHTVVIDKNAFALSIVEKIRAIKRAHKVNVVALLHAKDAVGYQIPIGAVDHLLIKPITIENVFNTIIALEEKKDKGETGKASEQSGESQLKGEDNKNIFEEFYGRRILIIDNERVNQKMLFTLLRRSGVNLTLAQSAQESLWMFAKMPVFDIILLSGEIDSESTLRFSQKIRNLSRYKGVPIIVMSKERRDDESSAADQLTSKPVQASTLFTLFNHYLSKNDLAGENRQYFPTRAFINTVSLAARDGFEMASFDEELYADILREFIALYSDSAQKMNSVLVKDDLQELKQICLDVKGVAANIGALRLSSITAQIHAAISKGKAKDLMALMNQYQPELERVKAEIQAYLKK